MNLRAASLLLLSTYMVVESNLSDQHKITRLPGQPNVEFQHFSGYIALDHIQERALFYYFVEAEKNPSSKPLVIWFQGDKQTYTPELSNKFSSNSIIPDHRELTGFDLRSKGPGCSSVGIGALTQIGSFRPKGQVLQRNEYSWNKEANMLYVDSPAGVGFSYSANSSYYENVDDKMTAMDNLAFVKSWLAKYPQYKNSDLYITGESYAGHYVPQVAKLMVEFNKREHVFNLKGIAVGNPLMDFFTNLNSVAEFLWSHGVISDSTYRLFSNACNNSRYVREYYRGNLSAICSSVMDQVTSETSIFVNQYHITLDDCVSSVELQSRALRPQISKEGVDVCVNDEITNYLNRKDVQHSLHARLIDVTNWTACSSIIKYNLANVEISIVPIVRSLLSAGIRVFVFGGDQDSVIPLTGSRKLVQRLANKLKLKTTVPYRVWFAGNQVGGWTQVYGNILSFATVRGGAHQVSFAQPERFLAIFKAFLQGRPLPETF